MAYLLYLIICTTYFSDLENWSLAMRCSLVWYPGHPFILERVLPLRKGIQSAYFYHYQEDNQISFFSFLYPFYILLIHGALCVYFYQLAHICVLFLLNNIAYVYYVSKRLNVFVYTNAFIFYFLPLCSALVYHGYTNANISPWWMECRLSILLSTKNTNRSNRKSWMIHT